MPQRLKDELGTQEPALPGNALNWIGGEATQEKLRSGNRRRDWELRGREPR